MTTDYSIATASYGGVLHDFDADHDGRVNTAELATLPPETAASLVQQSYSDQAKYPAVSGQAMIQGPVRTTPLDRAEAAKLLAALPPDKLASTLSVLSGWSTTHVQEQRQLAKGLMAELGPHKFADALFTIVEQDKSAANATPWFRALDRDGRRQVVQEFSAKVGDVPPSNPPQAESLLGAVAGLFENNQFVILGDNHSLDLQTEHAVTKLLLPLAIMGVDRVKVELDTSEQQELNTLSAGGTVRAVEPGKAEESLVKGGAPRGTMVQFMQENDRPRVEFFQQAHRVGMKVEAMDHFGGPDFGTVEYSRLRERAMTDEVAKSPGKTLVLVGAFHGIQNIQGEDVPLASQLENRGFPTASVKLECAKSALLKLQEGASPTQATSEERAYWRVVESPTGHKKSFAIPTSKLGDLTYLNDTPPDAHPLGVSETPRYRDSFDKVFILSPSDS